jgi:hypothetical protein
MLPIHTHTQQALSPYPTLLNQLNRIFAQIGKIKKAVFIPFKPFYPKLRPLSRNFAQKPLKG